MTVTWDERLITRARAADMAGTWRIKVDNHEYDVVFLRCAQCDGNIMQLPKSGQLLDTDRIISAVLGHMVKCHGYSLSGAGNE